VNQYETITWTIDDGIGRLTFDRPDNRNGITGVMMNELYAALSAAETMADLRVLVLSGAGDSFCVGADLKHYSSGADDPGSLPETFHITRLLHDIPAVTIAAVNGAAAGAGFGWACACDLRFAASNAVFNTAFLDVASAGDMAGPWTLSRLIGAAKARELYFLPGKFSAAEAKEMGLVIDIFEAAEFRSKVDAIAARLGGAAPLAIAGMKQNFLAAEELGFSDYIDVESERHIRVMASEDTTEAFSAFLEKRKPLFKGR
jgi:2-(1,2-epoxy-1,2-dihydrophenyl)acetyl-CoA isomerase